MSAPEWFREAFGQAAYRLEMGTGKDPCQELWETMQARGWESTRLTGGVQPDGTMQKARKIETLVIPRTDR